MSARLLEAPHAELTQFPLCRLFRSKYPTANRFNKSDLKLLSDCTFNFSLPTSESSHCPTKPTRELQGVKYNSSTNIYPIEKCTGRSHFLPGFQSCVKLWCLQLRFFQSSNDFSFVPAHLSFFIILPQISCH